MATLRYSLTIDNPLAVADYASVTYTESTVQEFQELTGTTDTAISFGGVTTADVFYLKSDQALTLNLQVNTGTNITIDANKPIFLAGSAITAAFISNASGSTANVVCILAGA